LIEADNPVVKFVGNTGLVPSYATLFAAGADLRANLSSPVSLEPGERCLIPTGISVAIPAGWEGQVRPRSGLSINKGVTLLNSPGTIDSDYRGELKVILINLGRKIVVIEPEERIAQLVISKAATANFELVEKLPPSSRGAAGFGSTGE